MSAISRKNACQKAYFLNLERSSFIVRRVHALIFDSDFHQFRWIKSNRACDKLPPSLIQLRRTKQKPLNDEQGLQPLSNHPWFNSTENWHITDLPAGPMRLDCQSTTVRSNLAFQERPANAVAESTKRQEIFTLFLNAKKQELCTHENDY